MNCKTITERLRRVAAIVDSWKDESGAPQIERDIALSELRDIYNSLLVVEVDNTIVNEEGLVFATNEENEVEVEVVFGSEDDEAYEEESESDALGAEPELKEESRLDDKSSFEAFYDALDIDALLGITDTPVEEQPAVESIEVAEESATETEPQIEVVAKTAVEEVEETAVEQQVAEPLAEPVVAIASEPTPEPVVEPTPEPVAEESKVVGAGLFDLNDIPVRSKSRRKMISLYSDNPLPMQAPAESVKAEPKRVESEPKVESAVEEVAPKVETQPTVDVVAAASQQRLGDTFGEVKTLADQMAKDANPTTPFNRITSLRQAIGLNDKFLMIRDLFAGDTERYEATIDTLDEFDDLDECIIYIVENFRWNPDLEAAKLLVSLIERKLA